MIAIIFLYLLKFKLYVYDENVRAKTNPHFIVFEFVIFYHLNYYPPQFVNFNMEIIYGKKIKNIKGKSFEFIYYGTNPKLWNKLNSFQKFTFHLANTYNTLFQRTCYSAIKKINETPHNKKLPRKTQLTENTCKFESENKWDR